MKVFGVGCIWFAPSGDEGNSLPKRDEFLQELKGQLEKLENISNVRSKSVLDKPYMNLTVVEEVNNNVVVPILHGCTLEFDIYLPFRIQEQIHRRLAVETVSALLCYAYEMPVLYVYYEDSSTGEDMIDPSAAVIVVRKYLEQKLNQTKVATGCVGPSPFHADFSLVVQPGIKDSELREVPTVHRGYARFELAVPSDSLSDFKRALIQQKDVFGKFYHLSNLRSRSIDHHHEIVTCARQLVNSEPESLTKSIVASFKHSEPIDKMNRSLVTERLLRMETENALQESDASGLTGPGTPLARFFDEYRHIAKQSSWVEFSGVAKFFEDRRHHILRNVTAVVAGVLGGLIGALIGSLLTFILTAT